MGSWEMGSGEILMHRRGGEALVINFVLSSCSVLPLSSFFVVQLWRVSACVHGAERCAEITCPNLQA